jgi:hypothetical protein
MRIISKFRDYYDAALSQGLDEKLLFRRSTALKPFDPGYDVRHCFNRIADRNYEYLVELCVVGFCGAFYPHVLFRYQKEVLVRNPSAFDTLLAGYLKDWNPWTGYERRRQAWFQKTAREIYDEHMGRDFRKFEALFMKHGVPYFQLRYARQGDEVAHGPVIELLPVLSDLHFEKVVDPYTAFQEISMYVGGVLGNTEDRIPKVSDEERYAGHGFDAELSFRKQRSDEPKRRKHRNP